MPACPNLLGPLPIALRSQRDAGDAMGAAETKTRPLLAKRRAHNSVMTKFVVRLIKRSQRLFAAIFPYTEFPAYGSANVATGGSVCAEKDFTAFDFLPSAVMARDCGPPR